MDTSSNSDLSSAAKKETFLAHIMSIACVYGVIPSEFFKSVVPLGCVPKNSEVEIEFGHAESVYTSFLECGDNLLVFVAVRAHQEALYILKNEVEGSVGFGKVENVPPWMGGCLWVGCTANRRILVSCYAMHSQGGPFWVRHQGQHP
jgi:hypothetical protein